MGRGENDLLFDPPRIKRKGVEEIPGHFQIAALGASLTKGGAIIKGKDEVLLCQGEGGILRAQKLASAAGDIFAINNKHKRIVSCDSKKITNGFSLKNLNKNDSPRHFPPLPQNATPLSLSLDKNQILCLGKSKSGSFQIWKTSIYRDFAGWQAGFSSPDPILMASKGDKNLFFFTEKKGPGRLLTLDKDGAGEMFSADGLNLQEEGWSDMIVPGREDGVYFSLKRGGDLSEVHYHDLESSGSFALDSLHIKKGPWLSLERMDNRLLLLGPEKLLVFSKEKLLEHVSLDHDYDQITTRGEDILLWKEGEKQYLYLTRKDLKR